MLAAMNIKGFRVRLNAEAVGVIFALHRYNGPCSFDNTAQLDQMIVSANNLGVVPSNPFDFRTGYHAIFCSH
jgi:hypothetical protein